MWSFFRGGIATNWQDNAGVTHTQCDRDSEDRCRRINQAEAMVAVAGFRRPGGDAALEGAARTAGVRVRLTKTGAEVLTNEIFVEKDGLWAKFVEVRYDRRG